MVKPKAHNHSFGYNIIHIVFVTKYRHEVINEQIESRLTQILARLCKTQDSELLECKADLGKRDHIHLLVDIAPRISLGKLTNILKTISSREIRKEFATEL
ncbi:MAG: IS200/IS605 family transposase, partial [Waterburya sp.]